MHNFLMLNRLTLLIVLYKLLLLIIMFKKSNRIFDDYKLNPIILLTIVILRKMES